jgi:hypothetical protein
VRIKTEIIVAPDEESIPQELKPNSRLAYETRG